MKSQLTYSDLRAYMEGVADQIEDSAFIFNCVDGDPYKGWIEFKEASQAKEFIEMLKDKYELPNSGCAFNVVAFNTKDESYYM